MTEEREQMDNEERSQTGGRGDQGRFKGGRSGSGGLLRSLPGWP